MFVLENVKRFAYTQEHAELTHRLLLLQGYVVGESCLTPSDFGTPQSRNRLFIVGVRGEELRWPFPKPLTTSCVDILDETVRFTDSLRLPLSMRRTMATWKAEEERGVIDINCAGIKHPCGKARRPLNEKQRREIIRTTVSVCLVAKSPGPYAVHLKRLLTVSEMLQLQGWAKEDSVSFPTYSRNLSMKMVGNSMCCTVLQAIFEANLATVAGDKVGIRRDESLSHPVRSSCFARGEAIRPLTDAVSPPTGGTAAGV